MVDHFAKTDDLKYHRELMDLVDDLVRNTHSQMALLHARGSGYSSSKAFASTACLPRMFSMASESKCAELVVANNFQRCHVRGVY